MAQDWPLPDVDSVCHTGPEWLLDVLHPLSDTARMALLMTLWRSWYVRNEITHGKKAPPTEASRRFLHSYISSLICIKEHPDGDMEKGKMVIADPMALAGPTTPELVQCSAVAELKWTPPPCGWTKMNANGSYLEADGSAGAGMALRDEMGAIIFSACRELRTCADALQAKLEACREGVHLALQWTTKPVIVKLDCAEAVKMIQAKSCDRSRHMALIGEIKSLLAEGRDIVITHIRRTQNRASHELAHYGRTTPRTAVWLGSGTDEVVRLCMNDVIPI